MEGLAPRAANSIQINESKKKFSEVVHSRVIHLVSVVSLLYEEIDKNTLFSSDYFVSENACLQVLWSAFFRLLFPVKEIYVPKFSSWLCTPKKKKLKQRSAFQISRVKIGINPKKNLFFLFVLPLFPLKKIHDLIARLAFLLLPIMNLWIWCMMKTKVLGSMPG
jgi:hypothetical protein